MFESISIQSSTGGSLDLHTLGVAAAYLGATIGVVMLIPQIVRTFAERTVPGVSALSWALLGLSCMTWMLYGIRAHELPQIPGNIFMVTGAAVIVLAVPSAISVARRAARLATAAAAIATLAAVLPPTSIGFLGFGIGLFSAVPQLIKSMRRPGHQLSAVSVPAWVLRGISQACWLFFAVVVGDLAVTISASFILTSSALLVVCELGRRDAASPPSSPPSSPSSSRLTSTGLAAEAQQIVCTSG